MARLRRIPWRLLLPALLLPLHAAWGVVRPPALAASACMAAIAAVEPGSGLPPGLLGAIAQVESGRTIGGAAVPWPWTADVEGTGSFYDTKDAAIAAVRAAQRDGVRSIDVGCMQVNLLHHPDAFANLEQGFDPVSNVAYAARLLRQLHAEAGDWARAAALYHSATPALGLAYRRKVMAAWHGGGVPATLPAAFQGISARAGPLGSPFGITRGFTAFRAARTGFGGGRMPRGRGLAAYRATPIRIAAPRVGHLKPAGQSREPKCRPGSIRSCRMRTISMISGVALR